MAHQHSGSMGLNITTVVFGLFILSCSMLVSRQACAAPAATNIKACYENMKVPCPKSVQVKRKKLHKKKAAIKKPTPVVSPVVVAPLSVSTPVAVEGCVEVHFITKPGDTAVRFPVLAPAGSHDDIAKDKCTAIKRAGDADFGSWANGFCSDPKTPSWVCDFANAESVSGKKVLLVGSYRVTNPGAHILRLPAYFADESKGYVTALSLIRGGEDTYPPETVSTDFIPAYAYGSQRRNWLVQHSTDVMGVRWFDYPLKTRIATVFYTKEEAEANKFAAQLFFPKWGESPASN